MFYCKCESPIMDVEHDAGCRRCGLPVDFTPRACAACGELVTPAELQRVRSDVDFVEHGNRGHLIRLEEHVV